MTQLSKSDKPCEMILYSRRSRAAISRRDLILRVAHCHSSCAISSFVPERTTSNSRVRGYRNGRCLGPNVAEENGGGTECGWKGEENENRVGSWECIVSYLASRSKLLKGGLPPSFIVGNWRLVGYQRKRDGEETAEARRTGTSSWPTKLHWGLANGHSWLPFDQTDTMFVCSALGVTTHPLQTAAGC